MKRIALWIPLAICLIALCFSIAIYSRLPDQIPTHWNYKGEIDGYGSKTWGAFLMPIMMFGMLGLFQALPWLSPRHFEITTFQKTYDFIVTLIMGLMGYMHVLFLLPALGVGIKVDVALMSGMFLFFMLLGNVLGKVQRNYFVGVRTPWTLASDRVWADTHRLAAWIFVGFGGLGFLLILLGVNSLFALPVILVGVLTTVFYSLVRYKQLERRGEL